MTIARARMTALFLLATSAGAFGFSLGWQLGHAAGSADADLQLEITTHRLLRDSTGPEETSDAQSHDPSPDPKRDRDAG